MACPATKRPARQRHPRRHSRRPAALVLALSPPRGPTLRDLGELAFGLAGMGCAASVFLAYFGVV